MRLKIGSMVGLFAVLTCSVARAELPSVVFKTGGLTTPTSAATTYAGIANAFTYAWEAGGRPAEIKALARGLRCNVDLVFEYVRNNIRYAPMYGMQKGAVGALLDKSGTAFDQVHLMAELLRECNASSGTAFVVSLKVGTINLSGANVNAWLGITNSAALRALLGAGAIPATVTPSTGSGAVTSASIGHAWLGVKLNANAAELMYDPAYKPMVRTTGLASLGSSMGHTSCTAGNTCPFMSASSSLGALVGSSSGTTPVGWVSGINRPNIETNLKAYSRTLYNNLAASNPTATLAEVVGGAKIAPVVLAANDPDGYGAAALPYGTTIQTSWANLFPDKFRTKLRVQMWSGVANGLDKSLFVDEFYGRRLRLVESVSALNGASSTNCTFGTHTYRAALLVGTSPVAYGSAYSGATVDGQDSVTLTVDHPYVPAAYMDEVVTRNPAASYRNYSWTACPGAPRRVRWGIMSIIAGFGEAGEGLKAALSKESRVDLWRKSSTQVADSASGSSDNATGFQDLEALFLSAPQLDGTAASILPDHSALVSMASEMSRVVPQIHHVIGLVSTGVDLQIGASLTSRTQSTTDRKAAMRTVSAAAALVEGTATARISGLPDRADMNALFALNNDAGLKFWSVTSAAQWTTLTQASTIATNLPGYSAAAGRLANLAQYANAGWRLVLTQKGDLALPTPGNLWGSGGGGTGGIATGASFIAFGASETKYADALTYSSPFAPWYPGGPGLAGAETEILLKGGSTVSQPDPVEALKKTLQPSKFESGAEFDDYAGRLQYSVNSVISDGVGAFPHRLDLSLRYSSDDDAFVYEDWFGLGWSTNLQWSATFGGDLSQTFGGDSGRDAVATIAAMHVLGDLYKGTTSVERVVVGQLVLNWLSSYLVDSTVTIDRGSQGSDVFVRMPWFRWSSTNSVDSDAFFGPPGKPGRLRQTGLPGYSTVTGIPFSNIARDYREVRLTYTAVDGTEEDYGTFDLALSGAYDLVGGTLAVSELRAPDGVKVVWRYIPSGGLTCDPCARYTPIFLGVENSLGRSISKTFPYAALPESGGYWATDFVNSAGKLVRFRHISPPGRSAVSVNFLTGGGGGNSSGESEFRLLAEIVSPDQTVTKFQYGYVPTSPPPWDSVSRKVFPFRMSGVFWPSSTTPSTVISYDPLWRVASFANAQAQVTNVFTSHTFGSEPVARSERVTADGASWLKFSDENGKTVQSVDPLGRRSYREYDGAQRIVRVINPELDEIRYTYDARSNQLTETKKAKPGSGLADLVTSATYLEAPTVTSCVNWATCNRPATSTDARGLVTSYGWTPAGLLSSISGPPVVTAQGTETPLTSFGYTSYTSSGAVISSFSLPTSKTERIRQLPSVDSLVTSYTYNAANKYVLQNAVVDAGGANLTTTYTFDSIGNVLSVDGPRSDVSDVANYVFDDVRRLTRINAPLNSVTRYTYDLDGRLATTRRAIVPSPTDSNPANPRPTDLIAGHWQTETRTYWPAGDLQSITNPESHVTSHYYDAVGRLDSVSQPDGTGQNRITKYVYDLAGQKTEEYRGWGSADQIRYGRWAYTPNGQVDYMEDPLKSPVAGQLSFGASARTDLVYDGRDRLSRTVFPYPDTVGANVNLPNSADYQEYTYDANGNMVSKRNRSGVSIAMVYDALNRETSRLVPDNPAVVGNYARTLLTQYDLLSRKTRLENQGETHFIVHQYDKAGRLDLTTDTYGTFSYPIDYTVDPAGNRTGMTWPGGGALTYSFDALNRMVSAVDNGGVTLAAYGYDFLSRRDFVTFGNGVTSDPQYYIDDALQQVLHSGNGGRTGTFSYGRNWVNQISSSSVTANTQGTWSEATFVDKPISAASSAYVPDKLNRYSTVGGAGYSYDLNGNLTGDGSFTFTYDEENRLRTAVGSGTSVVYTYDPAGRRRQKAVTGGAFAGSTIFVSDGQEEIEERAGSNVLLRRYAYGPGIDDRIAMLDSALCNSRCFYQVNHQGSTIALTRQDATLVDAYGYDAFGRSSVPPSGNPFRYTGRRFDPETDLYYYRARYYSTSIGRFLQTDPIGTKDDVNLYAYTYNDPLNGTDPLGEESCVDPSGVKCETVVVTAKPPPTTAGISIPADRPVPPVALPRPATIGSGVIVAWFANALFGASCGDSGTIGPCASKMNNDAPPSDAKDPDGAKAPGKPGAAEGFEDPKTGEKWVNGPDGRGGWLDSKGRIWQPTGKSPGRAHGGPHWDVQKPGGGYDNVRPAKKPR